MSLTNELNHSALQVRLYMTFGKIMLIEQFHHVDCFHFLCLVLCTLCLHAKMWACSRAEIFQQMLSFKLIFELYLLTLQSHRASDRKGEGEDSLMKY